MIYHPGLKRNRGQGLLREAIRAEAGAKSKQKEEGTPFGFIVLKSTDKNYWKKSRRKQKGKEEGYCLSKMEYK